MFWKLGSESIKTASPLTSDAAVITPHRLQALALIDSLRAIMIAIKRFDQEIADLAPKHLITHCSIHCLVLGPSLPRDC